MKTGKLFNKNFFLLWQGQTVSQIGSQIFSIALMFWLKHQTGSATIMGMVMTATLLPAALIGPLSGTIVDNFSRKKIIIISDLINGFNSLALAVVIGYSLLSLEATIAMIFAIGSIGGVLYATFNPAISAAIPDIVPKAKLQAANSLKESAQQLSVFIGQAAGGILFTIFGAPILFLFDGITFLFSAGSESFIEIPRRVLKKKTSMKETYEHFKRESIDGIKYVWKHLGIRFIFLSFFVMNFFIFPFIVLLPFYVEDTLGLTPAWYGYIFGSLGLGSIIGFGLSSAINPKGDFRKTTVLGSVLISSALLPVFGLLTNGYLAIITMFAFGIADGYFTVNVITILQMNIPSEMRGRAFALLNAISIGSAPVSFTLAGVAADLLDKNIPPIFIFCGVATFLTCLIAASNKHYRKFLAE